MKLYLDDNLTDARLADMLRKAGHDVVVPADVGNSGIADARHLTYAIGQGASSSPMTTKISGTCMTSTFCILIG